jgi:TolA-binding protein
MMSRTRYKHVLLAALVLAVAVVLVGCAGAASRQTNPAASGSAASATAVRHSSEAKPDSGTTGSLTTTEAQALDAQLRAIEDELDTLGLPGDENVDAIESGLD